MNPSDFDHLLDLTYRVIHQVHYDLENHIKSELNEKITWEDLISNAKTISPFEFVFRYESILYDAAKISWLQADLNGRKIKKASVMFSQEFESINQIYEDSFYDTYDEIDLRKAIKYSLFHFHQQLIE